MKKIFLFLFGFCLMLSVRAQQPRVDTIAVMIIDRMASVIGELNSCSFTLHTTTDINDPDYGLVKQNEVNAVYLTGPDKMHINTTGDKGRRGFWYNGLDAIMYWFDENNYATIEAPDNIIAMIDTIHQDYGVDFPAADFFSPTFADDMLEFFDDIVFRGKRKLNDRECWLIIASNKEMSAQVWFASDAFVLPQKLVIVYKNDGNRQYEATFSNWEMNPDIPASAYEFLPPPGARQIAILKTGK